MFSMLITQKLSTHCIWRLNEPGRSVSESFFSYFYLGNVASGAFGTEVCGHSFSAAAQRIACVAGERYVWFRLANHVFSRSVA